MELSFIQEINEARMFRTGNTLKGKTAREIGDIVFLTLLALEILRHSDSTYTKTYATQTLSYENFTAMRNNATDLHNLLCVMANQINFETTIQTDLNIAIPALQVKRYLRDIENDRKEQALDRHFFYKLEGFLKITNSEYKELRRNVVDWKLNSAVEKRNNIRTIKNEMNKHALQLDILQKFKTLSTS